jgi:asparagine synthase (glutamine-hydrolysing)
LDADDLTPARTARKAHFQGLRSGLGAYGNEVCDKTAAAFSIEIRHPFYDKRLAELCLALPPEQKLQNGWSRLILRRAMTNILPTKVQWRSGKSSLSPNFGRGLLVFERALMEETTRNVPKDVRHYINVAALREALDRFLFRGEEQVGLQVWDVAALALWSSSAGLAP